MATYNPPLEDLTIFDSSVFHAVHADVDSATLDTLYLKYPVAQGAEFIPSLTVGTGCGIGGNLGVGGTSTLNTTNIITNLGQTGTPSLTINDSVSSQELAILPNANATSFNPAVEINDIAVIGKGISFGTGDLSLAPWSGDHCGLKLNANGTASLGAGGVGIIPRTRVALGGTDITIASNLASNTTGKILLNSFGVVNNSSYTQAVQTNSTNPTVISASTTECFVITSAVNAVNMDTFANYLKTANGGWTCKIVNATSSSVNINITTADAFFRSWLYSTASLTYNIPATNTITITALPSAINGYGYNVFMAEDCSGYRTTNSTQNSTHYLNFSDSSATGVGAIQKSSGISCNPNSNTITATTFSGSATGVLTTTDNTNGTYYIPFSKTSAGANTSLFLDDVTNALTYNPSTSTLTASVFSGSFSGSVTSILTTSDNTNGSYYIPFSKTTAGANTALYLDDTTTPLLTYNPSNGGLVFSIGVCPRYDSSSNSANCSLFGNTTTGNITIANAQTTGSITIGNNHTNGNVVIGSASVVNGVVSVRPPLVLTRQLRTTNNPSYPPTIITDLGYINSVNGSSFTTSSLVAGTPANLYSFVFSSAGGDNGTYRFDAQCLITPTNLTAERTIELSISTSSATIEVPYYTKTFSSVNGSVPSISVSRTINIYADTTIYLVASCSFGANIATLANEGLFQFTRIA